MQPVKKSILLYDIEVLPNCFICCYKLGSDEIKTLEISFRKNDIKTLYELFFNSKHLLTGYNIVHYDTPIINKILDFNFNTNVERINKEVYEFSKLIINSKSEDIRVHTKYKKYKYFNKAEQLDLMTMIASEKLRVSLKELQVTLNFKNVEEMLVDWDKPINVEKIEDLINYCKNDVESTYTLLKNQKEQVLFRREIEKNYGFKCLSKDPVKIGVGFLEKQLLDVTGKKIDELKEQITVPEKVYIKDLILPEIKYESAKFNAALDWYKSLIFEPETNKIYNTNKVGVFDFNEVKYLKSEKGGKTKKNEGKTLFFDGLLYTLGFGGLHSKHSQQVIIPKEDEFLLDLDVESYYPSFLIKHKNFNKGLVQYILPIYEDIKAKRVHAKNNGDKLTNELFKLSLNGISGMLKQKHSVFYAPDCNLKMCINGQLLLFMLIEEMSKINARCVSANTDGATFLLKKIDYDKFKSVYTNWEKITDFKLEQTDYEAMYMNDVNSYIAVKDGWSNSEKTKKDFAKYIKLKGLFLTTSTIGKGLEFLAISKALVNYFINNVPVEETLLDKNLKIWDFLKYEKTDKTFKVFYGGEEIQRTNRIYVSKNGKFLTKKGGKKNNVVSILANTKVIVANKIIEEDLSNYDIDYNWYIAEAKKIIYEINRTKNTLFS